MSDTKLWTIAELNAHVDGRLIGDGSIHVERVADIASAATGEISYVEDEKFFGAARASKTSCLIAPPEFVASVKDLIVEQEFRPALIEVSKPKLAFALVAGLLHPQKHREPFVHASAVIAETADVDLTVFIGAHVAIGEGGRIGAGTRIEAGRTRPVRQAGRRRARLQHPRLDAGLYLRGDHALFCQDGYRRQGASRWAPPRSLRGARLAAANARRHRQNSAAGHPCRRRARTGGVRRFAQGGVARAAGARLLQGSTGKLAFRKWWLKKRPCDQDR